MFFLCWQAPAAYTQGSSGLHEAFVLEEILENTLSWSLQPLKATQKYAPILIWFLEALRPCNCTLHSCVAFAAFENHVRARYFWEQLLLGIGECWCVSAKVLVCHFWHLCCRISIAGLEGPCRKSWVPLSLKTQITESLKTFHWKSLKTFVVRCSRPASVCFSGRLARMRWRQRFKSMPLRNGDNNISFLKCSTFNFFGSFLLLFCSFYNIAYPPKNKIK